MISQRSSAHPHDVVAVEGLHRVSVDELRLVGSLTKKHKHEERIFAAIQSTRFLVPLLVDQYNQVLDGGLRLRFARAQALSSVLVLRVTVSDAQRDYLHYVVNKASEFQRWDFRAADQFLRSHMQDYVEVLEPLGFFGEQLLPESFFSPNIARYSADGAARSQYSQELGVAEWARLARQRGWDKPREHFSVRPTRFRTVGYSRYPLDAAFELPACKLRYWETEKALKRVIGLTGFVDPIVVSDKGVLIDGHARLRVIRELHDEGWWSSNSIPAFTISCTDDEATFIRMVMNRSHEFRRWDTPATEAFADANPHLRPLLEPLGLFADPVLPDDAWDDTPLEVEEGREVDSFDPSSMSLAEWAVIQRENHVQRNLWYESSPLRPPDRDYSSVFDLSAFVPCDIPTHDVAAALKDWEADQDHLFGRMTAISDSLIRRGHSNDEEWPVEKSKSQVRAELPEHASGSALLQALSNAQSQYLTTRRRLEGLKRERKELVSEALRAGENLSLVRKVSGFNTLEISMIVKGEILDQRTVDELDAELRRSEIEARMRRIRTKGANDSFEQRWLEDDRRLARYSKQLRTARLREAIDEWDLCDVDKPTFEALQRRVDAYFDDSVVGEQGGN